MLYLFVLGAEVDGRQAADGAVMNLGNVQGRSSLSIRSMLRLRPRIGDLSCAGATDAIRVLADESNIVVIGPTRLAAL